MQVSNFNAMDAYKAAQKIANGSENSGAANKPSGSGFSEMVSAAAKDTVSTVKNAEAVSAASITGDASITDVVTAVNSADMALKSVVAVRDKVIGAYQDIIKMPM